jgi:hypothetical protein
MKTIYIQPAIGTLFAAIGILLALAAKMQSGRSESITDRVRFKLALIFLIVGIGLWIWYFVWV